jgi:hypothetical protein
MGWGIRKEARGDIDPPLLHVQEWHEEAAASSRPPAFAPGALDQPYDEYDEEVSVPSARVVQSRTSANGSQFMNSSSARHGHAEFAGGGGHTRTVSQQTADYYDSGTRGDRGIRDVEAPYHQMPPQVIVIRDERSYDGVCCPLLTFIFGFSFPLIWLLACCQMSSNNPSARFLARCSVLAFIITGLTSGGIILGNFSKSGKVIYHVSHGIPTMSFFFSQCINLPLPPVRNQLCTR